MMKHIFLGLFAVTIALTFLGITLHTPLLYQVGKPLLMPTLLAYFLAASTGFPAWRKWVVLALMFSWGGDVLLMLDDMFVAGLASFLIAHLFYIVAYHQTGAESSRIPPKPLVGFIATGATLMWVLYPSLGGMLVPVSIYALVVLIMGVWAQKRIGNTNNVSFLLVAVGAIVFIVSDSLIAINRFVFDVPGERLWVMSTYICAQFMIVQGLLKHSQKSAS